MSASAVLAPPANTAELLELIHRLGGIDPTRVRLHPPPGTATERDLIRLVDGDDKVLCELIDGTLVEKATGNEQSFFAATLIMFLANFVRRRRLGKVGAPDSMFRMLTGNVRLPDVVFVSREQLRSQTNPKAAIGDFRPDLAVEILSRSNTTREIARKRRELFDGGMRLMWVVNRRRRTVAVYSSPTEPKVLTESDTLDGGEVLPGFTLRLTELFNDPSDKL